MKIVKRANDQHKQLYRTACAVVTYLGRGLVYQDDKIKITTDPQRERARVEILALEEVVFTPEAWGGVVERFRPGQWINHLLNLGKQAATLQAQKAVEHRLKDSLKFEPINDSEVFADKSAASQEAA